MVRFGVPGQNIDSLSYADSRLATVPAVQSPRRPTTTDKKFPLWCEWRTNKNVTSPVTEGEFWKLIRFESNGDATWYRVDFGGALPGVDDLRDQVNAAVGANVSGQIDIDGSVIGNGGNPSSIPLETIANPVSNTLDIQIQTGAAIAAAPADKNDAGILSADSNFFSIDTNGFMTVIGGIGFKWIDVTGTSDALEKSKGFQANNAGLVTLTLPATCAFGDTFKVQGYGAGGWKVAENGTQTIHMGITDSTGDGTGSIASTNRYDSVTLFCSVANTDFVVQDSFGNITVT